MKQKKLTLTLTSSGDHWDIDVTNEAGTKTHSETDDGVLGLAGRLRVFTDKVGTFFVPEAPAPEEGKTPTAKP